MASTRAMNATAAASAPGGKQAGAVPPRARPGEHAAFAGQARQHLEHEGRILVRSGGAVRPGTGWMRWAPNSASVTVRWPRNMAAMPKASAERLAALVDDVHFATRLPRHPIMGAVVNVIGRRRAEAEAETRSVARK